MHIKFLDNYVSSVYTGLMRLFLRSHLDVLCNPSNPLYIQIFIYWVSYDHQLARHSALRVSSLNIYNNRG